MLTVYIPNEDYSLALKTTRDHSLPFELINEKFVITHDISKALIVPVVPHNTEEEIDQAASNLGDLSDKIILIMMHTHISSDDNIEVGTQHLIDQWSKYSSRVAIVTLNSNTTRDIFYDFHFNRQKAYFVDYNKHDLYRRLWTGYSTKKMFELGDIVKRGPYKNFLVPNRVHRQRVGEHRNEMRQKLHDFITDKHCHRGNPESGYVLYPQEITEYLTVRDSLGGWSPISDDYYQTSFISVYVETITDSTKVRSITEKTYDPLIKGHFILPFGYTGLIQDIKNLGFLLPDWIDYSYDNIINVDERFDSFLKSVNEFEQYDHMAMLNFFNKSKDILLHNRKLFFLKSYDSLTDKVKARFNINKV